MSSNSNNRTNTKKIKIPWIPKSQAPNHQSVSANIVSFNRRTTTETNVVANPVICS